MDSEYIYSMASQIFHNAGWSEPLVWNFLDLTYRIPHPAFGYWMPLPSVVASLGMILIGEVSFRASQFGFVLIAACLVPLTAFLSWRINQKRTLSLISGILVLFPGFYWIYYIIPENMIIGMFLGTIFITLQFEEFHNNFNKYKPLLMGCISGMLHMSRADGLIWFFAGVVAIIYLDKEVLGVKIYKIFTFFIGYAAVTAGWYLHNLGSYGTIFPPGGYYSLFFTSYNDLFLYNPQQLTASNLFINGTNVFLQSRLDAFTMNFKNAIGVQGSALLVPFIIVGLWIKRRNPRIKFAIILWLLILIIMTFVFPFAGSRGGFLHSAASLQGIFWCVAPLGFERIVMYFGQYRNWQIEKALKIFSFALLALSSLLSIFVFYSHIRNGRWEDHQRQYELYEEFIITNGAETDDLVLIANPPGYYSVNERGGVMTPDGDINALLQAGNQYGVEFLIIEEAHIEYLDIFYRSPVLFPEGDYLGDVNGARIIRLRVNDSQ